MPGPRMAKPGFVSIYYIAIDHRLQHGYTDHPVVENVSADAISPVATLRYNYINDIIAPEISALQSLTAVNLSNNYIRGDIPPALTAMRLTVLDLSNNILTGSIPPSISTMATLQSLNLVGNSLTGIAPETVGLSLSSCALPTTVCYRNITTVNQACGVTRMSPCPDANAPSGGMKPREDFAKNTSGSGLPNSTVAAIIGGTVGSFMMLLLGVALFVYLRMRNAEPEDDDDAGGDRYPSSTASKKVSTFARRVVVVLRGQQGTSSDTTSGKQGLPGLTRANQQDGGGAWRQLDDMDDTVVRPSTALPAGMSGSSGTASDSTVFVVDSTDMVPLQSIPTYRRDSQ
ncbi:hypothetical protein BC831DRAFT_304254 [Entophlyctis helioformis]|nr:hypothetical protein BC831DRAFT_304254 [Entophlyctis helioformis]